jgi:hypothetical protein
MFFSGGFDFVDICFFGVQFYVAGVMRQTSQFGTVVPGPGHVLKRAVKIQLIKNYRTATQFHVKRLSQNISLVSYILHHIHY